MDEIAVKAENLSKRYRIGVAQQRHDTLRDALVARLTHLRPPRQMPSGVEHSDVFWALRDVSFEVNRGDIVGIIGRNGAGKSTLLKILSRITEPTTGKAQIHGRVGSLLEVGTGFHPELTGRENIYLNGAILGMRRHEINCRFAEIVDFAGIERFLDTPVKRYSSGMYVRLAFAVAAHLEPEILLVDEVLAVGDVAFQRKCLGKMSEVAHAGRTVLFISHNIAAISSLCNRAMILDRGRLLHDGETASVVMEYLHRSSQDTSKPLADRQDRDGSQSVRFVETVLSGSFSGRPMSEFFIGDDLYLSLTLQAQQHQSVREVWVGVTITDVYGNRVLSSSNRLHGLAPLHCEGHTEIVFHVPQCRLGEGMYHVDLTAVVASSLETADSISSAVEFRMMAKDIYSSGFQVGAYYGMFHMRHAWLVGGSESRAM